MNNGDLQVTTLTQFGCGAVKNENIVNLKSVHNDAGTHQAISPLTFIQLNLYYFVTNFSLFAKLSTAVFIVY